MGDFAQLIQSGGSDVMGLINQSGGSPVHAIFSVINVLVPILFFIISLVIHNNLDDSRAEVSEDGEGREYVFWGLYSIKVNLFMAILCLVIGWGFSALWFLLSPVGGIFKWYWKGAFGLFAASHVWTIVGGGLKSTAFQYFVDELYDDDAKMKDTCVEFGCGHALHGSQEVVRGTDYKS